MKEVLNLKACYLKKFLSVNQKSNNNFRIVNNVIMRITLIRTLFSTLTISLLSYMYYSSLRSLFVACSVAKGYILRSEVCERCYMPSRYRSEDAIACRFWISTVIIYVNVLVDSSRSKKSSRKTCCTFV